jgi:hypothetical protein
MSLIRTKAILTACLAGALWGNCGYAQSAADFLAAGRRLLATNDLAAARESFAGAVALAPDEARANVLFAATRVLSLAEQPSGRALLERVGLVITNRGLCDWEACPAAAGASSSAEEATALLVERVLGEIRAAGTNLARVADTNFTLLLSSNETGTVTMTVDYGDLLLLRSGLEYGRYLGYVLQAPAAEARLAAVRSLFTSESLGTPGGTQELGCLLSIPRVSDLKAAREAFSNAAALYVSASDFIRNRPTNVTRLFNLDPRMVGAEAKFRGSLNDWGRSINATTNK